MLRVLYNKYYNIYLVIKDMKFIIASIFAISYVVGIGLSVFPVYGHASPVIYYPAPNTVLDSLYGSINMDRWIILSFIIFSKKYQAY